MAGDSQLAHKLLDGLKGIEIGGGAHNAFHLDTINVDKYEGMSRFKEEEVKACGSFMPVDVVSEGDDLPFEDKSYDFVISSHVIEHFPDPIKAIKEWHRVARKYIFMIVPHRDRTFDRNRELTPLQEFIDRHGGKIPLPEGDDHHSVWNLQSFLEMCNYFGFKVYTTEDPDTKVGNGFTVVLEI